MFPTKEQLDSKWWHRFFKVILIVSTIVWAISWFIILGNGDMFNWRRNGYVYSFEKDFNNHAGQEKDCVVIYDIVMPYGVPVPSSMSFTEKIKRYSVPQRLDCGDLSPNAFMALYCDKSAKIKCVDYILDQQASLTVITDIIKTDGVKSKYINGTDWRNVFGSLVLLASGIICWIVLLKYGIYKAVLYIAYGKK